MKSLNSNKPINLHASCLMIMCLSKVYSQLNQTLQLCLMEAPTRGSEVKDLFKTLQFKSEQQTVEPLNEIVIQRIYVSIQRIYLIDEMIKLAMQASLDDLFYSNEDSSDWQIYNQINTTHSTIETEERLLKVYKELQLLIALGNASYAGK